MAKCEVLWSLPGREAPLPEHDGNEAVGRIVNLLHYPNAHHSVLAPGSVKFNICQEHLDEHASTVGFMKQWKFIPNGEEE